MRHEHHGKSTSGSFPLDSILNIIKNNNNSNILDLGCGDGYISFILAEEFKDSKIFAQDIYKPSIEKIIDNMDRDKISNIYPINSGGEKIPLDDKTLNIVLLSNVYHGFYINDEVKEVFTEVVRASKENSLLIIIERKKTSESETGHGHVRMSAEEVLEGICEFGYLLENTISLNERYYAGVYRLK